eukprot:COSAG04_NODE_10602_length_765_cov_0.794294_3_plen_26_part_01
MTISWATIGRDRDAAQAEAHAGTPHC